MYKRDKNYNHIHYWLRYNFGPASCCEELSCKKISTSYSYALLKGKKYEEKRDNFIMLCRSCHTLYDQTKEGLKSMAKKNKKIMNVRFSTAEAREKWRQSRIKSYELNGKKPSVWGENQHLAKLKESDIIEIRKLVIENKSLKHIAELYGVKSSTIHQIKSRKTWKHIK